jgi:hypothetical protein
MVNHFGTTANLIVIQVDVEVHTVDVFRKHNLLNSVIARVRHQYIAITIESYCVWTMQLTSG